MGSGSLGQYHGVNQVAEPITDPGLFSSNTTAASECSSLTELSASKSPFQHPLHEANFPFSRLTCTPYSSRLAVLMKLHFPNNFHTNIILRKMLQRLQIMHRNEHLKQSCLRFPTDDGGFVYFLSGGWQPRESSKAIRFICKEVCFFPKSRDDLCCIRSSQRKQDT